MITERIDRLNFTDPADARNAYRAALFELEHQYLEASLGQPAKVFIDAWLSLGGFERDPSLGHLQTAIQLALDGCDIRSLQRDVAEWAEQAFPGQTAKSKADHLVDEARELADDPSNGEEMADVFILLLHIAYMGDVDLMLEARKKMAKNRLRQWGPPDARGVCHHVESEPVAVGKEDGATCGREGCAGVMGFQPVKNCSCHLNPPCSACTDNPLVCLTCGANPEED